MSKLSGYFPDKLGKLNNGDVDTTGTASAGNTTTSTTRETTKETKNGVTYTKTITKETVTNPDGSKKVTTREVITTDKISAEDKVGHMNVSSMLFSLFEICGLWAMAFVGTKFKKMWIFRLSSSISMDNRGFTIKL